ncbi:class I SAM-dependent methyltransferase [Bacillus salipaludis]|uniref:rRNA adenine N-6-methyltransferase family protein n=1 Tax=Bacillus salipaludis TaxID=2547811 RepID=A0AA90Z690_9BACI|nr:rRNA adenine N-6-methyltransferase family protein [Bacillus salipaludis]MDQ6601059.1 rRNA adenine N-6-methyltransferase family protein [Bacillus salipaludis]
MHEMAFIKEFIKHPRTVGAVFPSSKQLAKQMIALIQFAHAKGIVEYGPGTGIFTEQLIDHKNEDTVLLVVESNTEFYELLKEKYYGIPNVHIIHGSAENIDRYIQEYKVPQVNYFVSGLPFTSLPIDISKNILRKTKAILGNNGEFVTFQYSQLKKEFFVFYFTHIEIIKVHWNIPPAYICQP